MKSKLQMLMVAGVATGAFALGSQAQAAFAGFDAADFYVIEAPGQYTLVNNSDDWYIYAFGVSNTLAGDGYTARTGQTDWDAYSCIGSCVGSNAAHHRGGTARVQGQNHRQGVVGHIGAQLLRA